MSGTYEHLRLCAARYAWLRRHQPCPRPLENGVHPTWAQWWSKKFGRGETLEQFAARRQSDGQTRA